MLYEIILKELLANFEGQATNVKNYEIESAARDVVGAIQSHLTKRAVDECLVCGTKFILNSKHVAGALVCGTCATRN